MMCVRTLSAHCVHVIDHLMVSLSYDHQQPEKKPFACILECAWMNAHFNNRANSHRYTVNRHTNAYQHCPICRTVFLLHFITFFLSSTKSFFFSFLLFRYEKKKRFITIITWSANIYLPFSRTQTLLQIDHIHQ